MGAKSYVIGAGQTAAGKVNETLQMILTIVIVAVVGFVIWNVVKAAKAGGKLVGDSIGGVIVQQQTGIPVARQGQIRQLSEDAHSALYGQKGFFGYWQVTEDEDAFIKAVNDLKTATEAKLFSQYYKGINGKSARADANSFLSTSERARISNIILQNLD